jgi:hypothetical protein
MAVAGVVVVAVGAWALLRGDDERPDLGTVSGQWMAEHRVHEREASQR